MPEKVIELKPIKESTSDFDRLEARIKELFRKWLYNPMLKELGETSSVLTNATSDYRALTEALMSGRITFSRGTFSGKLNASISKDLRDLGASFDRKSSTYKISKSDLPLEIRNAISSSEFRFKEKIAAIDKKISKILPEEIAEHLKCADLFDSTLWKTDNDFRESVKKITIAPKLTKEERERIADEWQNNMKLWVKDFAEKEIVDLRKQMEKSVFAGNRYESAVSSIQKSYGVTERKAKFLARQETGLLMAKFKEVRYQSQGITEYKWRSVGGSKNHPVRPKHKELAEMSDRGKIFKWTDPPNTAAEGESPRYNNPGEDYNCRCYAVPIVRF